MNLKDLVIAFRIIKKQKGYAFINILGLALGMACCFLVLSFILAELSYDKYHEKSDRIYRLICNLTLGETPNMIATTNAPPALAMRDDYPEVINAVRMRPVGRVPVKYEDTKFYEDRIFYAEAAFFDIFTFPMINGQPETALSRAHSIVLTEGTAFKYFGEQDPIGKVIRLNNQSDYTVTGVVKNVPENSHFVFDMLLSFESLLARNRAAIESWSSPFYFYSYVLLAENQDYKELENKLPALVDKYMGESLKSFGASVTYFLQPLTKIHLHSRLRHEISVHGDIKYVYIFGAVALFVLLIACFNFTNLATARSATRANEIGMRKILGVERKKLIARFLGESTLYSFLSLIVALGLVNLALPLFRSLSEIPLSLNFLGTPWLIAGAVGLALFVGLVAGIYPAFFLSSFQPITVLKGNSHTGGGSALFRKALVVIQFTISIALIISTSVVFNQLQFMKQKNLGFDKEQVIVVPIIDNSIRQALESIKHKLKEYPGILNVAASSHVPGMRQSGGTYQPEGYDEGQTVMMDGMSIDQDYIQTLGMEIVAGRNFSQEFPSDPEESILINETAAADIGWKNPVGKKIGRPRQTTSKTIVGVVKNFHFKSPHSIIRALYISNDPASFMPYRALFVKVSPANIPDTIDYLTGVWKTFDPNRAMDFYFLDESYDKQYRAEERLSQIFTYFTMFAIFIACLGLFGMSSFAAAQRTKEIGIRKVLGASVGNVLVLLSKEFMWMVLISLSIAIPVAYFAMNRWLQDFEFRIEIATTTFIIAGALAFFTAIITVSYQSIRAALANPADSIRYE